MPAKTLTNSKIWNGTFCNFEFHLYRHQGGSLIALSYVWVELFMRTFLLNVSYKFGRRQKAQFVAIWGRIIVFRITVIYQPKIQSTALRQPARLRAFALWEATQHSSEGVHFGWGTSMDPFKWLIKLINFKSLFKIHLNGISL